MLLQTALFHFLRLSNIPLYIRTSSLSIHLSMDIQVLPCLIWGFPGGTSGKEPACQCRRCKRCWFDVWVGKMPWRRARQPTPSFLPGKSHGQRSLVGYSLQGHNESDMTEVTQHIHTQARVLATVNGAVMNTGVHVSFSTRVFFVYMLRSGIARSHGSSVFSLRKLHTVLYSGSLTTSLYTHQQWRRVPLSP